MIRALRWWEGEEQDGLLATKMREKYLMKVCMSTIHLTAALYSVEDISERSSREEGCRSFDKTGFDQLRKQASSSFVHQALFHL